MKNLLTCDINGRTYMSYASRQRCSKGRATQSGAHSSPRAGTPARGCRTLGSRVVGHQAPSLSLSAACSATPTTRPGTRRQGLLYGQAFAPFGGNAPDLRRLDRFDPERDRQPSRAGGTPSWGRPWLTTRLGRQRTLRVEYQFDRLGAEKLAQVYACLVPDPMQLPGRAAPPLPGNNQEVLNDQSGRYLRPGVLGPPEGEPHDRQPSGSLDGLCPSPRVQSSSRVALPG